MTKTELSQLLTELTQQRRGHRRRCGKRIQIIERLNGSVGIHCTDMHNGFHLEGYGHRVIGGIGFGVCGCRCWWCWWCSCSRRRWWWWCGWWYWYSSGR